MDAGETLPGAFSAATFVETLFSVALAPMTRTSAVMLGLRRQRLCGHDGLGRGWRPRIPHWRQRLLRELARRRFGHHRCCGGASHRSERITPHLDARIFVRVRVPIANAVAERVERLERGTGHGFDVEGHLCPLNPNSPRSVFIFATFPGGCFSGDAAGMAVSLCSLRSALASILCSSAVDMRPAFTACVARAFALAAWLASGIGYERSGPANVEAGSFARALVVRTAINPPFPAAQTHPASARPCAPSCADAPCSCSCRILWPRSRSSGLPHGVRSCGGLAGWAWPPSAVSPPDRRWRIPVPPSSECLASNGHALLPPWRGAASRRRVASATPIQTSLLLFRLGHARVRRGPS